MGINYDVVIDIGAAGTPFYTRGNTFNVTSNGAGLNSYGIRLKADNIFADITGNDMSGGISGANDAFGIYLDSSGGNIGSDGTGMRDPVTITGNIITVTAATNDAGGIYL